MRCPAVESIDALLDVAAGAEKKHGHVAHLVGLFDTIAELHAVHVGQGDIYQYGVGPAVGKGQQGILAGANELYRVAVVA